MTEPDYNNCTLEVLQDVEAHIDRDANPGRYEKVVSILNDPSKRLILDKEHANLLKNKRIEKIEAIASIGTLILWVLGFMVLFFGVSITQRPELQIESLPMRGAIFVGFVIVGYKVLTKILALK